MTMTKEELNSGMGTRKRVTPWKLPNAGLEADRGTRRTNRGAS